MYSSLPLQFRYIYYYSLQDDIAVCTGKKADMERNLAKMKVVREKWRMKMHWGKTKAMMMSRTGEECKISVEGEEVEEVE